MGSKDLNDVEGVKEFRVDVGHGSVESETLVVLRVPRVPDREDTGGYGGLWSGSENETVNDGRVGTDTEVLIMKEGTSLKSYGL